MSTIDDLSGLARLGARAWLKTASWSLGVPVRAARAAAELLEGEHDDGSPPPSHEPRLEPARRRASPPSLRERGAELLRQSADVERSDGAHPAYARILEELHPDEARILRLLALGGPQPSIDVRSLQLIGLGSEVVAEGLTMIGTQAGCRHPERVNAYLDNLNRLGLIWFSKQPIDDPAAYQVLEAQPAALDAVRGASRAKTVQRSIRLTPFGRDFCEVCLPLERGDQPVPDEIHELGS
jgi:hypothetical protein